jgi:hypothetical protein
VVWRDPSLSSLSCGILSKKCLEGIRLNLYNRSACYRRIMGVGFYGSVFRLA